MARTAIAVTKLNEDGSAPPAGEAGDTTNGNSVANSGRTVVTVENTDAASQTVTFVTAATVGGFAVDDNQVSLAAGEKLRFSGFKPTLYGSSMGIDVSDSTVTLAAEEA